MEDPDGGVETRSAEVEPNRNAADGDGGHDPEVSLIGCVPA